MKRDTLAVIGLIVMLAVLLLVIFNVGRSFDDRVVLPVLLKRLDYSNSTQSFLLVFLGEVVDLEEAQRIYEYNGFVCFDNRVEGLVEQKGE